MNEKEIHLKLEKAGELSKRFEEPLHSNLFIWILNNLELENEGGTKFKTTKHTEPQKPLSEFLALANLKSHIDWAVAIAYHSYHSEQTAVTRAEFLNAYVKARLSRPANISDVIAKCIKAGYLQETKKEDKKAWQITMTGEKYIEEKLSKKS